jgi:hypothetical protein
VTKDKVSKELREFVLQYPPLFACLVMKSKMRVSDVTRRLHRLVWRVFSEPLKKGDRDEELTESRK